MPRFLLLLCEHLKCDGSFTCCLAWQKKLAQKRDAARQSMGKRLSAVYTGVRGPYPSVPALFSACCGCLQLERDLEGVATSLGNSLEVAQDVNQNMRAVNRDLALAIEKMSLENVGPNVVLR